MIRLPVQVASVVVVLALAVAACNTTRPNIAVPVEAEPGVVKEPPPAFPECGAEPFAFLGETSLAAIGLADLVSPAEANVVGQVWVTAGPVPSETGLFGAEEGMGDGRVLCIRFPDGSGMATTIHDAWQPPGAEVAETSPPAWPLIGVVALLIALLGASVVAFRRG